MNKLIKENYVYILLVGFVLFVGLYGIIHFGGIAITKFNETTSRKAELAQKENKIAQLDAQEQARIERRKRKPDSGKVILEVPSAQFSPEASFGVLFDGILANVAKSGIRVRSIEYNYAPTDDKILGSTMPGHNACELVFTAVGTYPQFQQFFKDSTKDRYLNNIYEVYIEPYDYNKSILITKFKIRLYTKSV